jgi:hypothetical protein
MAGSVPVCIFRAQLQGDTPMANRRKEEKELKRRYGKLADSMEAYYHHLDFRPLSDLDDKGFAYLMPRVRGVDMLDLNETEIGNASIALIAKLEYVKELRLKGCRHIDDDCIPFLNQIRGLELLHVKNTPITFRGLLQLRNQPALKTLLFSGENPEQDQAEIAQLKLLLPHCELIMDGKTV